MSRTLAFLLLLSVCCTSCVSHVLRTDRPARIERVGLDDVEDDLILVEVVTGLLPRNLETRLIVVPHGWHQAATHVREDGRTVLDRPLALALLDGGATERETIFWQHDVDDWSAKGRARRGLRAPSGLPPGTRRSYHLENRRRADGSVEVEVSGRHAACPEERVLAVIRLPDELTPGQLSTVEKVAIGFPLLLIDAAWIPITAVSFVLLIPFGSPMLLMPDEEV